MSELSVMLFIINNKFVISLFLLIIIIIKLLKSILKDRYFKVLKLPN